MDEQHRGLVVRINRLGDDLKCCRDADTLLATLGDLVAYTLEHFATEGRLLDAVPELPSAAAHREEHRRLLDDLRSLTVGLDAKNMSLTMRYLQEWLLRHVRSMDVALARALRERGLAQAV
jgi:hemerythrin